MDKKSRVLLFVFIALLVVATFLTYYRFYILQDYIIILSEETADEFSDEI